MKKVFAIIALMGVFTFGMTQSVFAQDEEEAVDSAAVEQVDSAAIAEEEAAPAEEEAEAEAPAEKEEVGMYKQLKTKFIEGSAGWMFPVALALIIGLAFCIERIIYLALADVKTNKMLEDVEKALDSDNVEDRKSVV